MNPVCPIHILIDNLPPGAPWYQIWIPIIIAIASILISGFSIYYTRKTFRINTRPYIWAVNYANLQNNVVIQLPQLIMLVCKGYPAKVTLKLEIKLGEQTLFTHTDSEQIQFPDGSEWSFSIGILEFQNLMNRPQAERALLNRIVEIDYSDLDGQKKYKSSLTQIFVPADNQWRTVSSEAS